jgi:ATP-dependent protease ClpP protease subunit
MPNQAKWYSMKATGKAAQIDIYADIGMWGVSAQMFKKDLEALGNITDLTIRINSYGGEIFDGNAIYNMLLENKASKTVIIDGLAASMASVIAMAADPGKLKMPENAYMMIHNPLTMVVGDAEYLRKNADLLDGLKKGAIKAYQRHATALTDDELWDLMDAETWLSAEDAKTYGLVDEIIDPIESKEPATNMGRTAPLNIKTMLYNNSITGPQKPKAKEVDMITCKHCGKEIPADAKFCSHCSKPTNETPATILSKKEMDEARMEAVKNEQTRISEIYARCSKNGLPQEFSAKLVKENTPLDKAIEAILDEIEKKSPSVPVVPSPIVKKDEADKFRAHAAAGLIFATGLDKSKEAAAAATKNGEPVTSLHGLLRTSLQMKGINTNSCTAQALVERSIRMAGTGSSDLPAILADVANKALTKGYTEAPVTFRQWTSTREVPDFKTVNIVSMSNFSDIATIPEGMDFKEGKISDKKETASITTKGIKFTLSRQAMINDDLSALTRVPQLITASVARKQNMDVYDSLTAATLTGPLMTEDGYRLFDASNHVNLIDPSGLPTITNIGTANNYLMKMKLPKATKDSTQQFTNLSARYLITGVDNMAALEQIFNPIAGSQINPNDGFINVYAGRIIPIFDAYLQSLLTTNSKVNAWYLATDPAQLGHYGIATLAGNSTPTLRGEPSGIGEALGFSWDCFYDYGVYLEDWRGMIYNDGASS